MTTDTGKPDAPLNVLLSGIVGSTAYGLDTEDSDVERRPAVAWLCDLDGTLALKGDRSPYDWSRVGEDTPNKPVITVARALAARSSLIFMSGRMEQCREQTRMWLHTFACEPALCMCKFPLLMRKDGDMRPDQVVKRELYERVKGLHEIEGALDDRDRVVKMWREELGLTCLQVAPGNF